MKNTPQISASAARCRFRRTAAFCAMLAVAMAWRADTLTDWDSWDYAAQAIQGHSSDLSLGRWWFIAAMRMSLMVGQGMFGLTNLDGYLAMQVACALMTALAVVVAMAWTYRVTRSESAEGFFAAMVILGPMFGIYSSAVMTESLTLLTLSAFFYAWQRATEGASRAMLWALVAGAAFGVAVDVREPVLLFGAWPILACWMHRPRRPALLLAALAGGMILTLGAGVAGAWAWYPYPRGYLGNLSEWSLAIAGDRARVGVSPASNVKFLAMFSAAASPAVAMLAVPAAAFAAIRRRRQLGLIFATLPYAAATVLNHDLPVNPRYVLPLVWILAVPAADMLSAAAQAGKKLVRLRFAGIATGVVLLNVIALWAGRDEVQRYYTDYTQFLHRAYSAMVKMPDNAAVVAGPATPVGLYLNRIGEKHFSVIGIGWYWPGEHLRDAVVASQREGRSVMANLNKASWNSTMRISVEWDHLSAAADEFPHRRFSADFVELLPPEKQTPDAK